MGEESEGTVDRIVVKDISYQPHRGLVLFGAAKESAQLGRHGDEFSVTLHYQNKAVPARAQVFGEGEVLDGKDGKGVEIVVPLTEAADGPLCSVICDLPEWLSLSPEAQAFLSDIFPTDNKAYEAVFLRKIHRYGDEALQYFVARQLSESFTGMRAYRVGAAVVMTYKSIELNDTDLQKEALDHVKMQLSHVGECEITNHPRTNREHLEVSLLCAQWHLELSLRRYDEFFSTLERCRSVAEGITNFFTPAYNLSMALLIYCALLARRGDVEKASEVADEGMRIFKSAVASATQQLTLFQELRISHRNVHLMLCTTKPDKRADADFNLYVQCSLRVTGDAVERLKKAAFDIYPVQEAGRS